MVPLNKPRRHIYNVGWVDGIRLTNECFKVKLYLQWDLTNYHGLHICAFGCVIDITLGNGFKEKIEHAYADFNWLHNAA